jgi:hypothetical protein
MPQRQERPMHTGEEHHRTRLRAVRLAAASPAPTAGLVLPGPRPPAALPPAGPRAAGPGRRALRPGLQGAIALAIFTVFWVGHFVPALVAHPELAQLDQSSMDPNFFVWSLRWWPYALGHGLDPMTTTLIGAPGGVNVSWLTTVPALAVLAWPVTAAFGPIVTFNLLIAFAPPAAAWAAFVLCRRLTRRFWPSLAGGAVYGFSAYEMNHSVPGHLNMAVSLLLPLAGYMIVLRRDGAIGRRVFTALLATALLLQMLIFLETFAGVSVVIAAGLPAAYWLARPAARPEVSALGRQIGVAYAAAVAAGSPYLVYVLTHAPAGFALNVPRTNSLNLASLLVPRPQLVPQPGWLRAAAVALPRVSQAGYIGLPLLAVAVGLTVWTWRSRTTRFLALLLVLAVLIAVGPDLAVGSLHAIPVPWALAWKLPLARSAFPVRFMVFGYLTLAVMLAMWLGAPLRLAVLRWTVGVLAVAVVLANIPYVSATQPSSRAALPHFITAGQYRHYLARGETVLVISERGNAGMLFQAVADGYFRIAGGFVNQAMNQRSDLPAPINDLNSALTGPGRAGARTVASAALDYLEDSGIGAVLFENNSPQPHLLSAFRGMRLHSQDVGGVTMFQIPHDLS